MVRTRLAVVGLVLVLLAGTVTVTSGPTPAGAVPAATVPTQWIALQYTELLGRAPTTEEWNYWLGYYQGQSACTTDNLLFVTKYLAGPATEFDTLYPADTKLNQANRLATVVRAVTAHDPNDNDWNAYFLPYLRDTSADAWTKAVEKVGTMGVALTGIGKICNSASPSRGFAFFRPIDLRAKLVAEYPSLNLPSRTQAQLQAEMNQAAFGATEAARTVTLRQGEVIRIGGAPNGNQGLTVPAGVTLTSERMPNYAEPAIGAAPKALPYARMGRIVAFTSPAAPDSQPADGRVCSRFLCRGIGMVTLGVGAKLSGVWVDGQGTGDTNSKVALVETAGSTAAKPTQVIASRLSEPGRDGAALRLRGNSAGFPCTNEIVSGNLVTAYSSISQFDQSGQAQWADGIVVSCEHATVSSNSIVDVTDAAILVLGSYNRAQAKTVTQRSQVRNNAILSAGNDAHIALGADAVGECKSDREGVVIPCVDQFVPRDMTGTRIHDNTFWTGPRTSIDIGLMVGGGALWGDHKITNAPTTTGAKFDRNSTGPVSARVNIAVDIHDMLKANVTANTLSTTLVDGNPRLTWNKCPQVKVAVGPQERAGLVTDLALPTSSTTSRGCLIGEPPASGPERVRIKADGSGFEGTNTKRAFKVWGGGMYDANSPTPISTTVDNFRDVRRMGANTVRLLIDLEDLINGPTLAVNQTALNNLGDIATAAAQTGIYLDITGIGVAYHHGPINTVDATPYTSWYDQLGTTGTAAKKGADEKLRWQAQNLFWSTVANKLKNQNSILLYDLVNEPTFGATAMTPATTWCFSSEPLPSSKECWNQNPVKTLTDPNNSAITRTPQQVVTSWISGMRNAIRQHDTTRPISVGLIAGIGSTSPGCPGVYSKETLNPYVDLMMPHRYPKAETAATDAQQVKDCKLPNKPLIVEEMMAGGDPVTLEKFVADTSAVSSGYLGHFIGGTPSQLNDQLATATYPNPALAIFYWLDWNVFFLRNGLVQSPAGQGIMPY